jgi:ABC-type polysaccharide transport system, permease component
MSLKAFTIEESIYRRKYYSPAQLWFKRAFRCREVYLLGLPVIALYAIFCYVPMYGVTLAFKDFDYRSIVSSPWVGLAFFKELFGAPAFWDSFRNSLVISLLKLCIGFPIPIIVALFLNEVTQTWFKKTIQTITFIPYLLSWAVMGLIISSMFSQTEGPVNALIEAFGGKRIDFLHSNAWFRPMLVLTSIWQGLGYGLVIYLAGLSAIDPQLHEAAMIDGAGRFKRMLNVTLPGLMPVVVTQLILSVGYIMSAGLEQVIVLYSPLVYPTGDIIDTFVYRNGVVDGNYSLATAAGLFQNLIGMALLVATNWISGKLTERRIF